MQKNIHIKKFEEFCEKTYLIEQLTNNKSIVAYHGSRSFFPFQKFENNMIGTGIVNITKGKYDGFFFTTEKQNAEYYSEYFICKVVIHNIEKNNTNSKIPSNVLSLGYKDKKNYIIEDILDGAIYSDIIVVPKNNIETVDIIEWEFIGDEDFIFEKWDETFGGDENYINTDIIDEMLEMLNIDINYLLKIPIFNKYYESKK